VRLYVSSASYPELREIESPWDRHRTWWRAFGSAARDPRIWAFVLVEIVLLVGPLVVYTVGPAASRASIERWIAIRLIPHTGAAVLAGVLAVSWAGDLMRPHLRRVSDVARRSCPGCGHLLAGPGKTPGAVRCPECGAEVPGRVFEPPYPIPPTFRAFRFKRHR
jgi:hypothetical protein